MQIAHILTPSPFNKKDKTPSPQQAMHFPPQRTSSTPAVELNVLPHQQTHKALAIHQPPTSV